MNFFYDIVYYYNKLRSSNNYSHVKYAFIHTHILV